VIAAQGNGHVPRRGSRIPSPARRNPLCYPSDSSHKGLHSSVDGTPDPPLITSRGRSRSMYLGRVYGECVTRALLVGRTMVIRVFAVALLWMHIRIRCPIIQVPLPEVHNKTTKINWLTLLNQQPFLKQVGFCETIHSRQGVG